MTPRCVPRLLGLSMAALLAACASAPPQATVQVFANQPGQMAGTTYRHDRLPSQAGLPGQDQLERAADDLLAQAGLRRVDTGAQLAVQLGYRQDYYGSAPASPSVGVGLGASSWGGGGIGIGLGFPIGGSVHEFQRMDVQVRDVASGKVVFQSQASSSAGASPVALLDAALQGFPNPPPGTRVVPLVPPPPR
ncbi:MULTISPECIES: hypothetical protein [Ramlibacter]|uniref:DUF4136 domain-containing protein n=1 Tax=Ramlibacter pinisoli TaxID=2682844 RepID=A0A6N8IVM8_9BURK|nr:MULTISPECIES: hypothetical protein [Ramlibacter]MBA2961057.1 hypothetical protein [Ramlibacter sp. CGMCC 1.13660]MVQ31001.1 hypothetical protein [Ramlibacter pinisoli]